MEYIDSISFSGWLKLLLSFFPTTLWTALFDLVFYIAIPLFFVYTAICLARKTVKNEKDDVWAKSGHVWLMTGLILLGIHILLYLVYAEVLTASFSDLHSLQVQYREKHLGASPTRSSIENISTIASSVKSTKKNSGQAKAQETSSKSSTSSKEYKVIKFFYNGYAWLHHSLYQLLWIVFLVFFFILPGIKMQNDKTQI